MHFTLLSSFSLTATEGRVGTATVFGRTAVMPRLRSKLHRPESRTIITPLRLIGGYAVCPAMTTGRAICGRTGRSSGLRLTTRRTILAGRVEGEKQKGRAQGLPEIAIWGVASV